MIDFQIHFVIYTEPSKRHAATGARVRTHVYLTVEQM